MSIHTLPKIVTTPAILAVADIFANPLNIRHVAEAARGELSDSLKAVGQLSRIWVRPHPTLPGKYELVDGERRWWGAQAAGLQTLDASVGDWSDEHVVVIAFTTGSATTGAKRLDPLAEARGLKWLKDRTGASLREIGERVGVSHPVVQRCITVIEGHTFIVEAVEKKSLPMRTAFELSAIKDPDQAAAALKEVLAPVADGFPPLSSDATHILIKKRYAKPRPDPVVTDDQVALTRAQSLEVFPAGATDPEPESGFVALTRPIPPDLLKPEIAGGAPIKFADVVTGVTVYVGVDEGGKSVPLVKLAEALAAVQPDDRHIFKEDVARSNSMPKPARVAGEPPSRRVEEEAAAKEAKKTAAAQKRKDKKIVEWLRDLRKALVDGDATGGLPFWTLLFDHAMERLSDDDLALLLQAEDAPVGGENAAEDLSDHAGSLPLPQLVALVTQMLLIPTLRAQGLDTVLVKEWHETVIAPPKPTAPEAVAFVGLPEAERQKLTSLVKAHAAGMSVPRLVREFGMFFKDVCGALELDADEQADLWRAQIDAVKAGFLAQGVKEKDAGPMIKMWTGCELPINALVPEELTKCLEGLSRVAASKAGKPAKPADSE